MNTLIYCAAWLAECLMNFTTKYFFHILISGIVACLIGFPARLMSDPERKPS